MPPMCHVSCALLVFYDDTTPVCTTSFPFVTLIIRTQHIMYVRSYDCIQQYQIQDTVCKVCRLHCSSNCRIMVYGKVTAVTV